MRKRSTDKIVVVGAGPVGSLLSILLAKSGYEVELIERRTDPRKDRAKKVGTEKKGTERGRSINLAISARGLNALRLVGLEQKALSIAIPMPGRMVHTKECETHFYPYGIHPHEAIRSISRAGLNEMLLTEAEATGRVTIKFKTRVTGYDPQNSLIEYIDPDSSEKELLEASPVFGTDGGGSAVRTSLLSGPNSTVLETPLSYGYKELVIPPGEGASKFKIEKGALHIWPRATFMLIALPNLDGSFTVTLFLPHEGEVSFKALSSPEKVREFFFREFPDAVPLIPDLERDFFENPTGHMATLKCAPWHHGGTAMLLGDAAHAIVPFFGQGMNAGFEDVSILHEIMNEGRRDWREIFPELERRRKANTDAIADLAEENFIEMRDKVADPVFQAERQLEKRFEKEFPDLYVSRYRMVSFSLIPYTVAREAGAVENKLLSEMLKKYGSVEKVDLPAARSEIEKRLSPILSPYLSH